jgi:VIT1/CCC1 family predicted Fe2+/Mn2+ transporter
MSREELGIDPESLGGSASEAALTSFFLFAAGAALPVLPFIFFSGTAAIGASVAASALGLFGIGAGIALFTGHSLWRSGARQLLLGLMAAAVTFAIGKLLGVAVGS